MLEEHRQAGRAKSKSFDITDVTMTGYTNITSTATMQAAMLRHTPSGKCVLRAEEEAAESEPFALESAAEGLDVSSSAARLSFLGLQLATIESFLLLSVATDWFFSLSCWPIVNMIPSW